MTPASPTSRRDFASSGNAVALASGVSWGISNIINGLALTMAPFATSSRWLIVPLVAAALYDGLRAIWQLVLVAGTRRWRELAPLFRGRPGTWDALGAAVAGGPVATCCFFLSIAFAGVSYGVAVSAISPVFGALVGVLFLKDRLSKTGWAGLLLTVVGAVIVGYQPPEGAPRHFYLGVFFAVVCALGWAFEGLFAKRAMRHMTPTAVNFARQGGSFVISAVVLLPAVSGLGLLAEAAAEPSLLVILAAAAAGSIGYLLYFTSVKLIGPGRAMPLNLSYVLWTAILGAIFLHDPVTWQIVVGAVAVVAGASLVVRGERALAPAETGDEAEKAAEAEGIR